MQFRNSWSWFLLALVLAAVIPSCKSPTSPQNNPTLTLILPDSARAFDSVVFRAHYSEPIQNGWKFEWQFGDSTRATTTDTSIAHVYDSAGTYIVQVALADSAGKAIAKQSGQLQVLPLNVPTLTLTVPDTVFWGDPCVMPVSSSQPLRPSWRYLWSFGDSTMFSSQKSSALHWYLNPGIYSVRVELDDTLRHIPLGSRTAMVHVVARHFDSSLLQQMRFVTVNFFVKFVVATSGSRPPFVDTEIVLYNGPFGVSPVWNRDTFYQNLSNSSSDTSTSMYGLQINQGSDNGGAGGYVNSDNTADVNFSESISSYWSTVYPYDVGENSYSTYTKRMGFIDLPFKSQTDSEIVFEATGPLLKQPEFSEHQSFDGGAAGSGTTDISIDWTNAIVIPRVTVTFSR